MSEGRDVSWIVDVLEGTGTRVEGEIELTLSSAIRAVLII